MALISKPNTFSAGQSIIASQHNSNFDTIYADYNGSIDNSNIAANAGILGSKLASLDSIALSAGVIPATNISITTADIVSIGTGTVLMASGNSASNTGWAVLRFAGGNTGFVPYWTGVTP
jgi:hypothetical protein